MEPLNRDCVTDDSAAVRELLEGLHQGDSSALDLLVGILYEELRVIAHNQRRRWRGDDTLGTTALLHEAYAKLRHQKRISIESRSHFLALASRAMRHILSTYAEQRRARKRGGGVACVSLSGVDMPATTSTDCSEMLAAMDTALRRLEKHHERPCRVVECRFYAGMSVEETAAALGMSSRTVKRDWAFAQAWLKRELEEMI
jgi:RNA polymerase sigma factor (TIGR02999 family)